MDIKQYEELYWKLDSAQLGKELYEARAYSKLKDSYIERAIACLKVMNKRHHRDGDISYIFQLTDFELKWINTQRFLYGDKYMLKCFSNRELAIIFKELKDRLARRELDTMNKDTVKSQRYIYKVVYQPNNNLNTIVMAGEEFESEKEARKKFEVKSRGNLVEVLKFVKTDKVESTYSFRG